MYPLQDSLNACSYDTVISQKPHQAMPSLPFTLTLDGEGSRKIKHAG